MTIEFVNRIESPLLALGLVEVHQGVVRPASPELQQRAAALAARMAESSFDFEEIRPQGRAPIAQARRFFSHGAQPSGA